MKVIELAISGVKIIEPNIFADNRGYSHAFLTRLDRTAVLYKSDVNFV